jgi:hypothetical protein
MKLLSALILVSGIVSGAAWSQDAASDEVCDFSSPRDFIPESSAVFSVHGMRLNFIDNAGFDSQRSFVISRCKQEGNANCFRAAYFSFGVPKDPISLGDSWVIDSEQYVYEQNIEVKLFGRNEKFAVIARRLNGKLASKFFVNDVMGLAAIMFFNDEGRASYQVYLQGDSCIPFPILIKNSE